MEAIEALHERLEGVVINGGLQSDVGSGRDLRDKVHALREHVESAEECEMD